MCVCVFECECAFVTPNHLQLTTPQRKGVRERERIEENGQMSKICEHVRVRRMSPIKVCVCVCV